MYTIACDASTNGMTFMHYTLTRNREFGPTTNNALQFISLGSARAWWLENNGKVKWPDSHLTPAHKLPYCKGPRGRYHSLPKPH